MDWLLQWQLEIRDPLAHLLSFLFCSLQFLCDELDDAVSRRSAHTGPERKYNGESSSRRLVSVLVRAGCESFVSANTLSEASQKSKPIVASTHFCSCDSYFEAQCHRTRCRHSATQA